MPRKKWWVIMKVSFQIAAVLLSAALTISGCGGGGGSTEIASNSDLRNTSVDTSDTLFQEDRVMQINIEMPPEDYQTLRGEGRLIAHVSMSCEDEFEWTHFKAKVSVDGEVLDNVDIRKKGFLGSLTASRPSLKLNFDTHAPGRRLQSLERMTLNNNRQDPGNARQCISYDMFRAVGLPAPRCGYARVTMNGQDLGIYSHVESVKKHFLRRNFSSDAGNLYEAQLADFGEFTKENYQLKTNEARNDRSDLDRVVEALSADDDNMPALLGQVVDLDRFLDYWAMEAITGHWDGATGNSNNHLVYRDPNSGLFNFIPWGTDGTLSLIHPLKFGTGPLYRYTNIPNRFYGIPEYREKFHQRVLALLDEVWKPNALNAELDRIRDLTGSSEADMLTARLFFAEHEARLRASIDGDLEQRELLIEDVATPCQKDVVSQVTLSVTDGEGLLEFVDENGDLVALSVVAQPPTETNNGVPFAFDSYFITVVAPGPKATRLVWLSVEKSEFGLGEVAFQGGMTSLLLIQLAENAQGAFLEAFGGPGSITFTEPPVLGEPVSFEVSGELWFIGDAIIRGLED
jgi:spore coat protein H